MDHLACPRQLLLVLADDWHSTQGELQAYQRSDERQAWQAWGARIPVALGRGGLGWGIGLHSPPPEAEPCKQEGDGRSPVGAFALTGLFGKAPQDCLIDAKARLPYCQAHTELKAVDDPQSRYYNQIVDSRQRLADWQSAEDMLRTDQRYDLGIIVAHNTAPVLPGAGSCIFLHVWAGPETPTAGCTAMAMTSLRALVNWLRADHQPCLVQLPRLHYQAFKGAWGLP